jgi:WD40 repeat protein
VVSGDDTTARLWEAGTGKEIASVLHKNYVYSVDVSPDGKYAVSGGRRTAVVWEIPSGRQVVSVVHDGNVNVVAFSPDGTTVISGDDKTARVWDALTGREIVRMNHDNLVKAVAFSPDGKYVISGGVDKTARVWSWRPEDLMAVTCEYMPRNLTGEEWNSYLGAEPYQAICPNLPIEVDAGTDET